MSQEDEYSVAEFLERQRQLEATARRKFPWDPSECTLYMNIPERQLFFACITCDPANAICYACGLRCHADHQLVELYSKRGYRCDCGTSRLAGSKCCLRKTEHDEWPNKYLNYGQNFAGKFCVCAESVNDSSYGEGAMFQCIMGTRCGEDWFHARCIVGISREEELARQQANGSVDDRMETSMESSNNGIEDETSSMGSDESGDLLDDVYPELPADFGALICPKCAADVPQISDSSAVCKRVNGYIFLKEDYGDIIRQSQQLCHLLHEFPFLNGKEETYTPERDEDDTSLLEAGEKALQDLPHEMVVEGLTKFNQLQSNLMLYLRDIGADGKTITREDVERFFQGQK